MKTKIILMAALLGVAALSANAGVRFGVSIGLPLPVVVTTPVFCTPAPVTVAQTVPACPDANYAWVPGYWSHRPTGWVWISSGWQYRPAHIYHGYDRDRDHYRGGYRR